MVCVHWQALQHTVWGLCVFLFVLSFLLQQFSVLLLSLAANGEIKSIVISNRIKRTFWRTRWPPGFMCCVPNRGERTRNRPNPRPTERRPTELRRQIASSPPPLLSTPDRNQNNTPNGDPPAFVAVVCWLFACPVPDQNGRD